MSIDLASLSPWLLLVAPLVVVAGYTVMGLTGFGSTMITVPILAHFLPLSFIVPLMAVIDVGCSLAIGGRGHKEVARGELKYLVPFMFVGFLVGVTVLVGVPDAYLRVALGVFAVAIGIHGIFNPTLQRSISALWCVPAGIVGGAVATIFGAGGPFYAMYLSGRLRDKAAIRATASTLIFVSSTSRTVIYAVTGLLLQLATLVGIVFLAPFVWAGLKIGTRIHLGLSQEQMRRVIGAILVITGVSLLLRAFL
jgi:uncharacterized membrane protein YfcA